MASVDNTSGPAPQRKEKCTLQCALSSKEEKSSCLRPLSSTICTLSHVRSVNNLTWYLKWSMASEQFSSGPAPQFLTPGCISSGLMQNLISSTPYVPPSKKVYDILCQPLFEEYFQPPSSVVSLMLPDAAQLSADTTGTPSSTMIV
ncbi:hypothetical protein Tco_0320660 [Tanacetum coccineum]